MPLAPEIAEKREAILRVAAKHGVKRIAVFGSAVHGELRPDSDIDFLIEPGEFRTPWFPGGLIVDLEELLGRSIDVTTPNALHQRFKQSILEEAVAL